MFPSPDSSRYKVSKKHPVAATTLCLKMLGTTNCKDTKWQKEENKFQTQFPQKITVFLGLGAAYFDILYLKGPLS